MVPFVSPLSLSPLQLIFLGVWLNWAWFGVSMETERSLLILYGSQTGSAQDVAERIGRDGKRRHYRVRVCSMDSYDKVINDIHDKLLKLTMVN